MRQLTIPRLTQLTPLLVFLLCQCGPNVENLTVDPEFGKISLAGSTIIVGGVTSMVAEKQTDDIAIEAGAELLRDRMAEKMASVNIIPATFIMETLGEETYWKLLDDYNITLNVSEENLLKMNGPLSEGPVYLALSRLESYHRWYSKGEDKDSTGAIINKYLESHRKLVAKFSLWDIKSQKLVWSGQVTGVGSAKNNYPQDKEIDLSELGIVGDIIGAALEEDDKEEEKNYVYPDFPSFYWAAGTLFHNFAEALLKK